MANVTEMEMKGGSGSRLSAPISTEHMRVKTFLIVLDQWITNETCLHPLGSKIWSLLTALFLMFLDHLVSPLLFAIVRHGCSNFT